MQCWLAFHYTLHDAYNRWWTQPHGSSSRHQSATTSRCSYVNYTCWKFHGGYITSWSYWFTNVFMAWHRHTSLTNFTIQQSRSFWRRLRSASSHELSIPRTRLSTYTATKLFQSPLYGSGTVFHSISHLLRHFLSSALAWRHTSSNSVIPVITDVVPAKWYCHLWTS